MLNEAWLLSKNDFNENIIFLFHIIKTMFIVIFVNLYIYKYLILSYLYFLEEMYNYKDIE